VIIVLTLNNYNGVNLNMKQGVSQLPMAKDEL
jgi:hypothetical protein